MKKLVLATLAALGLNGQAQADVQIFPDVVETLDLQQYLGKWYEVASTKPFFQKDCVCNTAEYSLNEEGNVDVVNRCRLGNPGGEFNVAIGEALATENPGKFKVSFGGFPQPFANYWVVDLASDYSYAVVSTGVRRPIWILSRTPELDRETLDSIYENLADRGFDTDAITPTLQAGCEK